MKRLFVTLSLLAMTTLTACHSKDQSTNPLLEVSQLDYQAPPPSTRSDQSTSCLPLSKG